MLRDKLLLTWFSVLLFSCVKTSQRTIITNNPRINHKKGVLLYDNNEFSGFVMAFSSGGDTQSLERYDGGKRNGESRYWYDNGLLREIAKYKSGKKHGIHLGFWLDGSKRFQHQFVLDSLHGNQKDWTDRGVLWRDVNFNIGKEDGWQHVYNEKGKVLSNYKVVKGRRYGLVKPEKCDTIIVGGQVK